MGLVNGIERNLHRAQELHVLVLRQRLRSHVEQFRASLHDVFLHLVNGRLVQRRVEEVCCSLLLTEVADEVHLVLHQSDEWRYDDGHAIHEQRRQLIAETLSTTCGHEHEGVLTVEHALYNGFLVSLEGVEAKIFLQGFS